MNEEEMQGEEGLMVRQAKGNEENEVGAIDRQNSDGEESESDGDGHVKKEKGWGSGWENGKKIWSAEMEAEQKEAMKWPVQEGEGWNLL